MKKNKNIQLIALTPGQKLKDELKERGLTQKEFARLINVRQSHLSEYINGVRPFTAQFAFRLEDALKVPAATWLAMQKESGNRDEELSRELVKERKAAEELNEFGKYLDMSQFLTLDGLDLMSKVDALASFKMLYKLTKPEDVFNWIVESKLFNKALHYKQRPKLVATWVIHAKRFASDRPVTGTFNKQSFEVVTQQLVKVLHENYEALSKVEDILANAGIRFNYWSSTPETTIEGFSSIEDGVPTIILGDMRDRIDDLSFFLLHELWFLYNVLDDKQKMHIRLRRDEIENDAAEKKAEEFAATSLVPDDKWKLAPSVFMNASAIQDKYSKWAEENGLNKWIVLGRIKHETGMCAFKTDGLRRLRTPDEYVYRGAKIRDMRIK